MVPTLFLSTSVKGFSDFDFFRNSKCFMCFWFGLEIPRRVCKERFLKYWMVYNWYDISSSEKSSTAPYKSWKKFLWNCPQRLTKKSQFCTERCKTLVLSKRGKSFTETGEKIFGYFCKLFSKLVLRFQGQTKMIWSKVIYENHWTPTLKHGKKNK